jgi:sterol 3beta-glucosyltransferase
MKIAVVTYGTEGDTRPLAALCHALDNAGHASVLLADASTLGTAQRLGVRSHALAGDIRGALGSGGAIANVVAQSDRPGAAAKALADIANVQAAAWLRQTVEAARGCDAIVCAGLAAFVGLSAAEALDVPAIGAGMFPLTPTREFASPFLPPSRVPRFLNRASHHLVTAMLWRAFRPALNAARAEVCGLPPRRRIWSTHPALYGFSPSLVPRPADWPANAAVCGQWIPPEPEWQPPQSLSAFLAAGEPPVYIGFGSMTGFDAGRMRQVVVDAVAARRAQPRVERHRRAVAARQLPRGGRPAARLAVSADVGGGASRRFGHHAFGRTRRSAVGGGALCGRSVLLGAPAGAGGHCAEGGCRQPPGSG